MTKEDLLERVLDFAVKIIKLVNKLPKTPAGFKIGSQLVSSGTSIGANTQEAQDASSKPDFINKMSIALREAKESKFWLQLIKRSELLPDKIVNPELKEADELCAIYSTIVKKARFNLSNVKSQMSNVSGFTLIELLVALTIVAVLTAIGLTTYQGTQSSARDSVRKNDLNKLATALELYLQKNGKYPHPLPQTGDENCTRDTANFYAAIDDFIEGQVPKDPKTNSQYCYIAPQEGRGFRLFAKLENCNEGPNTFCDDDDDDYNYTLVSDNLLIASLSGATPPPSTPSPTPSSSPTSSPTASPTPSPTPSTSPSLSPTPSPTIKRVFVTHESYNGNLMLAGSSVGLGSATDGLDGADKICQSRANDRNLGGTWAAWISDSTGSPSTRFSAAAISTTDPVHFKLLNNRFLAIGWTDLIDGNLFNKIDITEFNQPLPQASEVWTNTNINGTPYSSVATNACAGWTSTSSSPSLINTLGSTFYQNNSWTIHTGSSCDQPKHIYCFEQ